MKIKKLKLKNFRGYKEESIISFNSLTAIVGKNDIGKSTILEALDIFFNDSKGAIKLDNDDFNVDAPTNDHNICISAVFTEIPTEIILDETCSTTLQREYLLNVDGDLEITKEYKSNTSSGMTVKIRANHPTNDNCSKLLSKKQADLQKMILDLGLECEDNRKNTLMRTAIWNHFSDSLNLQEVELDVSSKESDIKSIWEKLQLYIPNYSLFQSDRKNCDGDGEVQEPLKEAVKQILQGNDIAEELNNIAERVKNRLQDVSDNTLEKLREMNSDLANSLHPKLPDVASLKWSEVFKNISITGDGDIPINKRGSGVRRLILLNFFRAEAERKLSSSNRNSIIYAIEEPETSQHYEHQKILIKALKDIAGHNNSQVIITTHSGDIVKSLNWSDLRIIVNNSDRKEIISEITKHLPYPSLNEVNYCVYDMPSVEYHNELYGYLQAKAIADDPNNCHENKFEQWLISKGLAQTKNWIKENRGMALDPQPRTLQTYIRNLIHHPENTRNEVYNENDLRRSIQEMIVITDNLNQLQIESTSMI